MTAKLPKISYPVPSNRNGHAFSSVEDLLSVLGGESSGLYLVGSQGMWHGGIHITNATIPWCALSTDSAAENEYCREPYKGEQFIRCMADGEIVAWRVCKDYEGAAIEWLGERLFISTSFVLVKHYIQPGDNEESGLTFFTLYMNLAPWAAYTQQGAVPERKAASSLRYYISLDDLNAGRVAGSLPKDTAVTLSDNVITSQRNSRQYTEVSLVSESSNAAGEVLAAGARVWTVSDRGNLREAGSAPVPSWWAKCSPAYTTQPTGRVNCTSRTNWAYYLSRDDVLQYKNAGSLVAGFPLSYEPANAAQQVIRPGKNPGDAARTFSLVILGQDKDKLKKGDRVWVVSDGDSLVPASTGGEAVFDDVCIPASLVSVAAGDNIGHMGFYQLPEDNGKRSRYQVHIECLSMDDMEKFITNPGKVGEDTPAYLTWQTDAPLFENGSQGITAGSRKTRAPGILTLAKVPGADAEGNVLTNNRDAAWFQIRPEGGWLAAGNVRKVSQYALGELGFATLDKAPESFDLLDGVKQPNNVVKGILEQLYKAAQNETRTSYALNKYNYQRLLEKIDSNQDGHYSEQEYVEAVHVVSYRDRLYRLIAKHASEWYYGKDDPLWKNYLDRLTTDAPLWKKYLETFIEKMQWMKAVPGLGPEPWHMHPVVMLNAMNKNIVRITREMLRIIWPDSENVSDVVLNIVAEEISNKFDECNVNTKNRLYHFFAQIYQEVGPSFNLSEGFNYRPQVLIDKFSYYRNHPQDAQSDGYIPGRQVANKQNIANRAYGNREGNGDIASGDGWRYRGRGMKQLTFKNNYRSFTNYHERVWRERVDFQLNPDFLLETIYAVRSALYFWDHNKLYSRADNGTSRGVSDSITRIVNLYDNHYEDRYNNLMNFLRNGVFDDLF
ncbi:hypothetical protein PKO51_05455 [Yokenella regensburgei]|jgi:predicted chitinase|uniref:glycoside hydrolase family 19 protein n=1 Tax=Yokenella regensburgei TaxID=158877 RepID=UPI0027D93C35|nr:hypothetical protein [Yokenella regensburgei]MDQ4428823.1 hypothetical protein [Yokenella regensburgei]